ncbi:MAG: DUF2723 domain-containing protein [Bacteroidales bacterium]|jgi:hypothetical protein|nr:DUF2723 domain-containing protein [Bacteroidales bacterium]
MNDYMHKYRRINNITGWVVFAISLLVYTLTLEPTVSFWDCGEFILSSFKLQVGHPPGAPFYMLLGRFFSLFSFGNESNVAVMINFLSALASAFTIMFLFWTITHLVRKVFIGDEKQSVINIATVMASGLIGALTCTFSDTFWFSAVEGEVYATSSLFTAMVFWAILKWEDEKEERLKGRWLVLIAYLMGLSIGVHLLNLLALPAIVLVYYFKNYKVSPAGVVKALLAAFAILGFLVFILLPYTVKVAGWFELLFVNGLGLPFHSGLYIYLIILIAALVFGIRYSIKKKKILLNYAITILAVILLGYSSFALIPIRASARPPMNQNDPSDVFSMIYYINREQYGSTPLLTGSYYTAPVVDIKKKRGGYIQEDDRYVPYQKNDYVFDERFMTIFPRMYSAEDRHHSEYEYWGQVRGKKVMLNTSGGSREFIVPTFGENLRFFFRYQLGYMYGRYFMWNFAGRQNDIQGNGNVVHGNWISGIKAIDNSRLGDQELLPDELMNNPARNTYFFLPLILGLLGMAWQYKRERKDFWVIFVLFIMTGIAIVVYLNQSPLQPRERDYAYAGSFYAFSIWVGMGLCFIVDNLRKVLSQKIILPLAFLVCLLAVPVLMALQNWDDHDRSGRYTARDIGSNYLNSCDENAVIFTYGDNDSFPVWYAQDVEGIRTDVRVANLSYLSAGWYIDMMRQKAYESERVEFTLGPEKYRPGKREQLPVTDRIDRPYDIIELLKFAGSEERQSKIDFTGRGDYYNYIPSSRFLVPVDSAKVLSNGTVKDYQADRLLNNVIWNYEGREMYKNNLAVMDMIGTNEWERPFYFASTVPPSNYMGLDNYFQMEGLAYRVAPLDSTGTRTQDIGFIDTRKMYDNVMNRFKWGNASDPDVYLDENNRRMFSNFRRMFGLLAEALISEGDTLKAREVLHKSLDEIPGSRIRHDYYSVNLVKGFFNLGDKDEAMAIATDIVENAKQYLEMVIRLDGPMRYDLDYVIGLNLQSLISLYNMSGTMGISELRDMIEQDLDRYYNELIMMSS